MSSLMSYATFVPSFRILTIIISVLIIWRQIMLSLHMQRSSTSSLVISIMTATKTKKSSLSSSNPNSSLSPPPHKQTRRNQDVLNEQNSCTKIIGLKGWHKNITDGEKMGFVLIKKVYLILLPFIYLLLFRFKQLKMLYIRVETTCLYPRKKKG